MQMQTFVPFVPLCSCKVEQGFLACASRFSGFFYSLFLCSFYIYIDTGSKHTLQSKQREFFSSQEALGNRVIQLEQRNRTTTNLLTP